MPNPVYDDEDKSLKSDTPDAAEMRRITGITPQDEEAAESAARNNSDKAVNDERASLFNASGDAMKPKGSGANESAVGSSGGLFKNDDSPKRSSNRLSSFIRSKAGKRSLVGTGIAGVVVGGGMSFLSLTSGPMQLIHLSQILRTNFSNSEHTTRVRSNNLFRFARTGDVGETRVGHLGSKVFSKTITQLKGIGIEFDRNPFSGAAKSATFDTKKLSSRFPELKNMSEADARDFISKKFNVPANELGKMSNGKFVVNTTDYGISATRGLTKSSLSVLDDGKIVRGIKFRVFGKFFNSPSWLHPIERAKASTENKLATRAERVKAERDRVKSKMPADSSELASAKEKVKSETSGVKAKLGGALMLTGMMCVVHNIADDVVTINREAVVEPSALQAADKIAVGAQVQTGQDFDSEQIGAVTESFLDKQSKSIWSARALNATADPENATGTDIPADYAQAYSPSTTAENLKDTLGGGGWVGKVACSDIGQAVQITAGIGLLISGFFDGGLSWGAAAGLAAVNAAKSVAAGAAVAFVAHLATDQLATDAVVPDVMSGPLGGNLMAYGARELSNMDARANGGVELSRAESLAIDMHQAEASRKEFQSKSLFARVFDTSDYRSVASRVIDSNSQDPAATIQNVASSVLDIGPLLSHTFGALIPKLSAASQPYPWPFPRYGIPSSVLNDPKFADPYANADDVAKLLATTDGSGQQYIDRAKQCFGVSIEQDSEGRWGVNPLDAPNPNKEDYTNADCSDLSDTNWKRVMLFVTDTRTMDGIACWEDDDTSCANAGVGTASAAPVTEDTSGGVGSNNTAPCAVGADQGIQDGYLDGNKVPVRICVVRGVDINTRIAKNFDALVAAAHQAGFEIAATSGFRTMGEQQALYSCYLTKKCNGGALAAKPGFSNHQMGLAVDISCNGGSAHSFGTSPCFAWMKANAATYGLKNLPSEAWHWSVDGH